MKRYIVNIRATAGADATVDDLITQAITTAGRAGLGMPLYVDHGTPRREPGYRRTLWVLVECDRPAFYDTALDEIIPLDAP